MRIAIVVGGAESVGQEVEAARALCDRAGASIEFFACNDMIAKLPDPCRAVTLHQGKLVYWLAERQAAGLPPPSQIWAHYEHEFVTDTAPDLMGSCGLFGWTVATRVGHHRVIFCGVPMTTAAGHFVRKKPWRDALGFQGPWLAHRRALKATARSLSGWTRELLGAPGPEFFVEGV